MQDLKRSWKVVTCLKEQLQLDYLTQINVSSKIYRRGQSIATLTLFSPFSH